MSASFGPANSINSPITQSGRVVINATKDAYSIYRRRKGPSNDPVDEDQLFSVLTHELAFRDTDRAYETKSHSYDNRMAIVTSCNGGSFDRDNWAFVGVAATRALHNETDAHLNEDDCVVQVGGLCTIMNNSTQTIQAGDWVCWDFPGPENNIHRAEGTPNNKRVWVAKSLADFITNSRVNTDSIGMVQNAARERAFGRAMSTANPGEQMDILLGCIS